MKDAEPHLVPAVHRAILILNSFRGGEGSFGVSDLSRRLDLNKSTVYGILNTLAHHRFLDREESTKKYRLGPALLDLGSLVGARLSVREVAHPYLIRLAERFRTTVLLASYVPDGRVLIVDSETPELDFKISASVGSRISHWASPFGKLFHAAMAPAALAELLDRHPMTPHTSCTTVDPAAYLDLLAQVRRQGFATDDEEFLHGIRGVGVPVNDQEGRVVAALVVLGFCRIMDERMIASLKEALPESGRRISRRLGAQDYPTWSGTWTE